MHLLWEQIRGNAKWDLIKTIFLYAFPSGLIALAWVYVLAWLNHPVRQGSILAVWFLALAGLLFFWLLRFRLDPLTPRIESVSQFPDGTGYKKPGRDNAFVIPFKNAASWWHSALPESCSVTAHIDFFSEAGEPLESSYAGVWIGERTAHVSFPIGRTKELIVAIEEQKHPREYRVPEGGVPSPEMKSIIEAFKTGAMLSLKHISNVPSTVIAVVHLDGAGYTYRARYRVFLERDNPGLEPC
jgi:hypothetical protein